MLLFIKYLKPARLMLKATNSRIYNNLKNE